MKVSKTAKMFLFFVVAFIGIAFNLKASPITVPSGLHPGDTYRLLFTTSTIREATSTNIDDYNAFVSNVAATIPELAALNVTWKVIGSTPSIDAIDNIGASPANVGIYRLDGSKQANGTTDFFTQVFVDNFFTENGNPISWGGTWSGTRIFWDWAPDLCGKGDPGHELGTAMPLAAGGWAWSFLPGHFMAMSSEITVTPEPSFLLLLGSGICLITLATRRKKK
jgi:hypothetical protein